MLKNAYTFVETALAEQRMRLASCAERNTIGNGRIQIKYEIKATIQY